MSMFCPCHSKELYSHCCEPYHTGELLPKTALQLMRSRYSAYARCLPDYVIATSTHQDDREAIIQFCKNTKFYGLEIAEFIDGEEEAFVTFIAYLEQGGKNASFREKSYFVKQNGKWLYDKATEIS